MSIPIYGLSGRIGSGKDTVGRIIQYISMPERNRTMTIEEAIADDEWYYADSSQWHIKKYAAKLKWIAGIIMGVDPKEFESQEYKASFLPSEWDYWCGHNESDGSQWRDRYSTKEQALNAAEAFEKALASGSTCQPFNIHKHQMTVRQFLQELGTDACRAHIHPSIWVNALFADYKLERYQFNGALAAFRWPKWIITDLRFPNEAKGIRSRGGITIRVNRVLPGVEYPTLESLHPSETSLDDYKFDYVIDNTGTLAELMEKVQDIMSDIHEPSV